MQVPNPPDNSFPVASKPPTEQLDLWAVSRSKRLLKTYRRRLGALWSKRHPVARKRALLIFSIALGLFGLIWGFFHWTDPDRDYKITNFLAAFYPFPVSIFVAFLPDMERSDTMRPIWRSVIPIFGLLLSLLLWHQQTVNLQAARADQNNSISKAVNSANDHTDKQISASNDHTDKQIEKVRRELSDNSTGTNNRLDEVDKNSENQNKAIQELLPGFQSTLGTALGKVGKPDPPQRVTLKFSLLSADDTAYTQNTALVPDKDGVFTVKFWILNDTGVTAHLVDVWIDLCESCEFIGEDGAPWQRPAGMSNLVRYCRLDLLNQHAATSVMSIRLRIKDDRFTRFSVGMRYSCELCVESPKEQIESILTAKQ